MKKFSEFVVGESFYSTCSISHDELEEYLKFSRVKNVFLENKVNEGHQLVSGRAILSRMEGEFTRLNQIYGNQIIFLGTDGDSEWGKVVLSALKIFSDDWHQLSRAITAVENLGNQGGEVGETGKREHAEGRG